MVTSASAGSRRAGSAFRLAVAAVAVFDLAVRAEGMLTRNGALSSAYFDEGVYTATAGSLVRGDVPYRDFVFLHPPGITLLLAPLAGVAHALGSLSDLLVAARWLMAVVAVVNVVLIAYVAWRWKGWVAGLVSSALYASYLPSVHTEGHVMLEPVVTLGLLVTALLWAGSPIRSDRRSALAGAVAAVTALAKLTGGVVLLALVVVERARAPWRQRVVAAGSALAVAGVVLLPFVVLAGPSAVFDQIVLTQLRRPGHDVSGGTIQGFVDRLDHLGSYGPFALNRAGGSAGVLGAALAAVLVVWAWRSGHGLGRFFAVAVAAGSVTILASPDYYDQYPVTVFASIAVIVGCAAASIVETLARRTPSLGAIAAGVVAVCVAAGVADTVESVADDARDRDARDPAALIEGAANGACISADLPEVLLAVDRLPPRDATGDRLIDPFGTLVREALRHDDYRTTKAALHSTPAQRRLRQSFAACPFAITKGRLASPPPRWSNATRAWFLDRFEVVVENQAGVTLWRQRR